MKTEAKITAEDVLSKFIKGNVKRDYRKEDRKYYTVSIFTALKAMRLYHKLLTRTNPTHNSSN